MNISSLIVYVKDDEVVKNVISEIEKMQGCEIITSQNGKIIVVMSVENIDEEIKNFKNIEKITAVTSVAMIYSYQEDLQDDLKNLNIDATSEKIFKNIDAKDIIYNGAVANRIK
ncbi:MAG: chaperone NapD [Campylobacter sp.]